MTYLHDSDEILMTLLAEALTLAAIEVHERGVQDGSRLGRGVDTVQGHGGGGLEREVQAHLVVLEGNKRERQGRGPVVEMGETSER